VVAPHCNLFRRNDYRGAPGWSRANDQAPPGWVALGGCIADRRKANRGKRAKCAKGEKIGASTVGLSRIRDFINYTIASNVVSIMIAVFLRFAETAWP
jgi:hypothetical protein